MFGASKIIRRLLAIAIFALVLTVLWQYFSTGYSILPADNSASLLGSKKMTLNGIRMVEIDNNNKTLEIKAEKAIIASDESSTGLTNFNLLSEDERTGQLSLMARKGALDNNTQDVAVEGGVVVRDVNGRTLITDSLNWHSVAGEIRTDDVVHVFGENFMIQGRGMVAEVSDERVTFLSDVTVIFMDRR